MAITNGYCTLAEYKDYASVSSTNATDDAVIEDIIEGVSRSIDTVTGRTFYARTETHYYDTPQGRDLVIDDDDLLTITTLTNGDGTVITSTYYKLLPLNKTPKNIIRLTSNSPYLWSLGTNGDSTGAITVLGTWGLFSTVTDDIKEVCKFEASAEYKRRFGENANNTATVTPAGVVITPKGFSDKTIKILSAYRMRT